MHTCPKCSGRVATFAASPPYQCDSCGAVLEYVPWRFVVANSIPMAGGPLLGEWIAGRSGGVLRIAAAVALFLALSLLSWPLFMRLRIRSRPDRFLKLD